MSLDNELKSIAQAYLSMLDEKKMAKENDDEDKVECPKCKGEGCDHCDDKGYHMKKDDDDDDEKEVDEAVKKEDNTNDKSDDGDGMDKVQPKALKKKFADRKDKDLDNDGDTDDSDEYLHKRRKAISKIVFQSLQLINSRKSLKRSVKQLPLK